MVPTLAEQALRLNPRRPPGVPAVVLMTDPRQADPLALARRLPPGAAVVLRHYDDPGRAALGRALARICRTRRLRLFVAADVRLAVALGADGLHLPEGMARPPNWRGRVSRAAHSQRALARADADFALLSPVFPTASHPGAPTFGALRFAALARTARLPVLALGGVNARTVRVLRGAQGVATVGNL